jgi:hypothetical protein
MRVTRSLFYFLSAILSVSVTALFLIEVAITRFIQNDR